MILDKYVEITGNSKNIKYYTEKGYQIDRGIKILVKIEDLSNGSTFKVNIQCDKCKAIKKIASKNYKLLPKYREKYPGCQFAESKFSDHYNKLVIEVMGGEGNNEEEKENKIIRNISKVITVDKSIQEEET